MIAGCYTSTRLPVTLVFSQACASREEALAAEHQIKGWSRRKKEALMQADWVALSDYSKRRKRCLVDVTS
ncbi:MAG: GIY-YIG nuclease family protein [Legionellales bacterium]